MKKYKKRKIPYLIAEIGINHNGSIKLAKQLIDLAKSCDFDAVKFQKRDLDICIPDYQKNIMRDTPWGRISYLDYKKKIEFGKKEFNEIDNYCKKIKIDWFCSAWDLNSLKFLKTYKMKYNKIASALITNTEFLTAVAKQRKITFISTGMSTMKDINRAINIFKKNKCDFILMHCVSSYPVADKDLNLNTILNLKKKFKCKIGYSGHEANVSPSIAAWLLGSDYIERHITLDRSMWGTDQSASLSEQGMKYLSGMLKKFPTILGDGIKKINLDEKKLISKFRFL